MQLVTPFGIPPVRFVAFEKPTIEVPIECLLCLRVMMTYVVVVLCQTPRVH